MPNLRIALTSQTFYSGNAVTGNVLLDIDQPKSYKQISIRFNGKSYVHWTERHSSGSGSNQRTTTRSYTSTETYVDLITTVWSNQQSPDGKLAPGPYSWPFSFVIPPTAPTSFEGTVGRIRYNLIGRIGTGLLKFDHAVEVQIPVLQLVRITDPRLLEPLRQEVQKTVCCMCCTSQPIILTVAVPKTGFCVGESFQLHVSLENGSARRVVVTANLTQHVVYYAQGHRRLSDGTLVSFSSNAIEPHATRNWDPTIEIPINNIPIVHDSSCSNIKITYTLTISCRIPNTLNLTTAIPLQLGNVQDQSQNLSGPTPNIQQGAFPQPSGVYPPPQFTPQQPTAPYPPLAPNSEPPPPYQPLPSASAAPVGWAASDFSPEKPQESLADFPAHEMKKL